MPVLPRLSPRTAVLSTAADIPGLKRGREAVDRTREERNPLLLIGALRLVDINLKYDFFLALQWW